MDRLQVTAAQLQVGLRRRKEESSQAAADAAAKTEALRAALESTAVIRGLMAQVAAALPAPA